MPPSPSPRTPLLLALLATGGLLASLGLTACGKGSKAPAPSSGTALDEVDFPVRNVFVSFRRDSKDPARPPRTREEALARAKEAVARLRAPGASFGAVAKEMSDDAVSAAAGGFAGFIAIWSRDDARAVQAVAALPDGGISEPVDTGDGFQVLQRLSRAEGKAVEAATAIPVQGFVLPWSEIERGVPATQTKEQAYAEAARAVAGLRGATGTTTPSVPSVPGANPLEMGLRVGGSPGFEALAEAARALAVGAWSDPVETPQGWAVVQRQKYERAYVRHLVVTHRGSSPPAPPDKRSSTDAANRAAQALERIRKDRGSWDAVVAEYSDEPYSRTHHGFMGDVCNVEIPGRRVAPEFEQAIFALEPGEISDVVETRYGFHVFWRVD